MIRLAFVFCLAASAVAASSGCARGLYGPSVNTPAVSGPRDLDKLTVSERRAMLDRAAVWRPVDTASLDLLAGPPGRGTFAFDAPVTCEFDFPDKPLTGLTPKFNCTISPDDTFKVKYGDSNGEVFAEVAATRLFWALGFAADRMFPVKITCLHCPANPYRVSTSEWGLGKPGNVRTMVFESATIERKLSDEPVEVPGYEGWSWKEIEALADNEAGATRAHIDALKLLAAFVQHVDSKPENQALVCLDETVARDGDGNQTCRAPMLMVKDLGSTFAAASKITFPKLKLESWRSVPVWKNEKTCQANLTSSMVGTLANPMISEGGRKFLADRLSLLTDAQLRDLFTAARVERWKDNIQGRPVTPDNWVEAFKEKRAQIVGHRCST